MSERCERKSERTSKCPGDNVDAGRNNKLQKRTLSSRHRFLIDFGCAFVRVNVCMCVCVCICLCVYFGIPCHRGFAILLILAACLCVCASVEGFRFISLFILSMSAVKNKHV